MRAQWAERLEKALLGDIGDAILFLVIAVSVLVAAVYGVAAVLIVRSAL